MSLDACAALVERGDPDRFRTLLAALQFHHDLTPNQPVGVNHIGIHRSDDVAPRLL